MRYGYEYLGATSRMALTGLTDRCWITITGALHSNLSTMIVGSSGAGKAQTVKVSSK